MKDSNWLLQHQHKITSQHGEDGIIEKIFNVIKPTNLWCVEFGAGDGKHISNTWNLIKNGWKSVQIETNIDKYKKLVKEYDTDSVFCLNRAVGFEPSNSLDKILADYALPGHFDFLSIDVDGIDYQIWEAVTNYQPRVVCIECCPKCRKGELHIHNDKGINHIGSSLASMTLLAQKKGYELIAVLAVNAFYVLKDLYPLFEIENNPVSDYKIWAEYD